MRLRMKMQLVLLDNLTWVLPTAFSITNALFTSTPPGMESQSNILYQSATPSLLVLGMGIVMMVGELDLSMEATLALVLGVMILATQQLSLNPMMRIFIMLASGVAVSFSNGSFVTEMRINSFLLTMSSRTVMWGLVLFLAPLSLAGFGKGYTLLGRGHIRSFQVAILALIATYTTFEFTFRKTAFGRKFMLTGGSRRVVYTSDINANRIIICVFVLASLPSAVTGLVTTGRQSVVSSSMSEGTVMMVLAGAILGGCSFNGNMGKPVGMLGGTLLLGMTDNALNLNGVDVNLVSAIKGGLIFLATTLDWLRFRMNVDIMHRENMRKLV